VRTIISNTDYHCRIFAWDIQ